MDTIYQDLTLDFMDNRSLRTVKLKQNENGARKIRAALTFNGVPIMLAGSESVTYSASVEGVSVAAETACTISNNNIIIPVSSQLTVLSGKGYCDVKISFNGNAIYTATFLLDIERAVVSSSTPEIVPTSDFIAELKEETQTTMANYIRNMLSAVYPEYTQLRYTENIDNESSTMYGDNPYYVISADVFDTEADGLLIWKNGSYMMPPAQYSFEEITGNNIKISFHMGGSSFEIGDIVYFTIYKKPASGSTPPYGISTAQAYGTSNSIYGIPEEAGT